MGGLVVSQFELLRHYRWAMPLESAGEELISKGARKGSPLFCLPGMNIGTNAPLLQPIKNDMGKRLRQQWHSALRSRLRSSDYGHVPVERSAELHLIRVRVC
jgi:hypothetical protein